ncbi:MAG: electron transport complex subunit RsxC [Proteobacteria bacterium]|nr:MAG: electron transport complex subunit RsxC [Pseudomonadota bacterium]
MAELTDRLSTFHGGLVLKHHKELSARNKVVRVDRPQSLRISLRVNRGHVSEPVVAVGDRVNKYQVIAQPIHPFGVVVHAPFSGVISAIEEQPTAAPDAESAPCIELDTDDQDRHIDYLPPLPDNHRQTLIKRIQDAGILGMGGAGFPTHVKYDHQIPDLDSLLIINGAECEPYITCDERLMLDEPVALIKGTDILMQAVNASQAVIAIEDNLGGVKSLLDKTIQALDLPAIRVIKVPTIYPTGGEKQLIKVLTGLEVPSGQTPLSLGIVMQNVATTKAVYDAVEHNRPLTERLVTVTGDNVGRPGNYLTPVGTPFYHLLAQADCAMSDIDKLVVGGPMMGYPMPNVDIGVDKTTNCLLLLTKDSSKPDLATLPCIRCGDCVKACPQDLLPQQLFWYIQGDNLEKARDHHVFDCIECGACSWVCPSHIDLVSYYRYAKSELTYLDYKKAKAQLAKQRHESREQRLEDIKAERQAKRRAKTEKLKNKSQAKEEISAVLDRIKNKPKDDGKSS